MAEEEKEQRAIERRIEDRLGKLETHIMSLLIIAENHTLQIGIMMKAFLGVGAVVCLSVLGTILVKVLGLKIVGG